jgi:hypothetical protein
MEVIIAIIIITDVVRVTQSFRLIASRNSALYSGVRCSNLGQQTVYPDRDISIFTSASGAP